jgi:hypothetical protein
MTIAQFAHLACELFGQLCCSFFKLIGALAALLKQALDINSAAAGVVFYRSTTRT